MSALDRVRSKFKTPPPGASRTSKSPSAGFAGSCRTHSDFERLPTHVPITQGDVGRAATPPGEKAVAAQAATPTLENYKRGLAPRYLPDDLQRAQRRARAEALLKTASALHAAYVSGDDAAGYIPLMMAVRVPEGVAVSGEVLIPAEKWWPAMAYLMDEAQKAPS